SRPHASMCPRSFTTLPELCAAFANCRPHPEVRGVSRASKERAALQPEPQPAALENRGRSLPGGETIADRMHFQPAVLQRLHKAALREIHRCEHERIERERAAFSAEQIDDN